MKVEYRTKKLKKQCEDPKIANIDYGSNIGNKLTQRIGELIAATSLLDIKYIPAARLHRLKGTRADEYAVDLAHPYRLVFTSILQDGKDINELESINIVRIEEVTDYHGKQKR
ncbi:MAG: type II toxin-antitoxin system RelE/ParE family toxin [Tissierellaceae bacterium]